MLFTVFCRISNILKNHAFWQTIRIWFEDNFTFLGPWGGGPRMWIKKSRIRETKHLSTDADSSTDTTVGWTKNSRKPNFFEKRKKSSKTQKLKTAKRYANISDIPFDQRTWIPKESALSASVPSQELEEGPPRRSYLLVSPYSTDCRRKQ